MIEKLYSGCQKELLHFALSMTGGNVDFAEELVQEAFLRAMLHKELLSELEEGQQKSWLYRTVKNAYVDRIRHNAFEQVTSDIPEVLQESEAYTDLEWQELLKALPDLEGVLFQMRYLEGYNSKQIGELFHLPPGTVRSKLSLARKHLKILIGGKKNV